MTLTSDQLKAIIIELGTPENLIIDTKIMKLAYLGAGIYTMAPWAIKNVPLYLGS